MDSFSTFNMDFHYLFEPESIFYVQILSGIETILSKLKINAFTTFG